MPTPSGSDKFEAELAARVSDFERVATESRLVLLWSPDTPNVGANLEGALSQSAAASDAAAVAGHAAASEMLRPPVSREMVETGRALW